MIDGGLLFDSLAIKRNARRKAGWLSFLVFIGLEIYLYFLLGTLKGVGCMLITLIFAAMCWYISICLSSAFEEETRERLGAKITEQCLSTRTKVIPNEVQNRELQLFLIELKNYAGFYAEIDKDSGVVVVITKFPNEEEFRLVERLPKEKFLDCYSIYEEVEQEET